MVYLLIAFEIYTKFAGRIRKTPFVARKLSVALTWRFEDIAPDDFIGTAGI